MKSSRPAVALVSRAVHQLTEMNDHDWLVGLGRSTLEPLDRQLWESLLERNCDPSEWLSCSTNDNNNGQLVEATSEEIIPSSAATPEVAFGRPAMDGAASLRRLVTQVRVRGSIGTSVGPQTTSSTARSVRVVNWAAETCDKRWCQLADASEPPYTAALGEIRSQEDLLKMRLMEKQGEITAADAQRPKSFYQVPARRDVNGVELQLSSAADSPQPQAAALLTEPPATNLHGSDERIAQPPADLHKFLHSRLLDAKSSVRASSGEPEVSASQRIGSSSDPPWQQGMSWSLALPVGTSEVSMEISGDSLSSDTDEASAAEPLALPDAMRLADIARLSYGPAADWRNVVSISVITGGGQTTSVTSAALAESSALAPLSAANSRTVSTNTEQSVSTNVAAGASEGCGAALCAYFAMNEPQQLQSLRRPARPQTARALLRHGAVSLAPVWHVCGSHPVSARAAYVTSLLQCLADNARFAWQTRQPARCSHVSSQLMPGLMDVSQSSESQLVLHRFPVYALHSNATDSMATVDGPATSHCVLIAIPEILSALRYVTPSDTVDWLPPEASNSLGATNLSPLAALWSQNIRLPQPTDAIGLQLPLGSLPAGSAPPAWPVIFQTAPSGSDAGNFRTSAHESARASCKSQQLQQLRRIVRMKMQQKVQEHEFVSCSCCSCCSSSLQAETGAATRWATDAVADGGGKSISDPLERSLGGLLESLRSCRQTAAVAAKAQRQRHRQSSNRQLVSFVERILLESTSQQAALSDLLASLKDASPSPPQQDEPKQIDEFDAPEEATTKSNFSCSQSDQFYSFHTGTAGLPDRDSATLASGRWTCFLGSPDNTNGISGYGGTATANNNAENAATAAGLATPSPASSPRGCGATQRQGRHRNYFARRGILRMEDSAALLLRETVSRSCSVACSVHQDRADGSYSRGNNLATTASVQQAATTAATRQSPARLSALKHHVLAQVWGNRPPISQRQPDRLDPTVSSFIWWSLVPHNRRIQLSPHQVVQGAAQDLT